MLEENLTSYPMITPFGCDGGCHDTEVQSGCTALGGPGLSGAAILKAGEGKTHPYYRLVRGK